LLNWGFTLVKDYNVYSLWNFCYHVVEEIDLKHLWITIRKKFYLYMKISPSAAWEGGWSLILRAANTGLTFLTTIILSRTLGANDYGVYAYAYAITTLLTLPAQAGLPNLIVRETARGITQKRFDLVQGVWQWSGRLVGILAFALLVLAGPPLYIWQHRLDSMRGITLAWALILVPLVALGNLRGAALQGLKKIITGQIPEFVIRPLFLLVFLGTFPLLRQRFSPSQAMSLNVLAALIAFLAGAWMLWRSRQRLILKAEDG